MKKLALIAVTLLLAPALAGAADLLIRGARVHTAGAAGTIENADVLVQDGRIVAVGGGLAAPPGAMVVEANGRPVTPGLFGGVTQFGLEEVSLEASTFDAELKLPRLRGNTCGVRSSTSRPHSIRARRSCR